MQKMRNVFNFEELLPLADQVDQMPRMTKYTARDGNPLYFRSYPASSDTHVILMHGSTSHSATLHAFAANLSESGTANVHTPDLRGHGFAPLRRGDIDYTGQLEDDLADLIAHLKATTPRISKVFIGGHSSGGGLALRFGSGPYQGLIDGLLLLAPYLGRDAPMVRRNAGGWVRPNIPKIILLSVLEALGIRRFGGSMVLSFNLPRKFRTGFETTEYSFRLMKGMHPPRFRAALRRCKVPICILAGVPDESVRPKDFKSAFRSLNDQVDVRILPDETHLGIIMSSRAMQQATDWLVARVR